jgi:hypothetical protein
MYDESENLLYNFYLFYVKHLAMHGGKISANSEGEGLGCSFTVEIEMQRKAQSPPIDSSLHQVHVCLIYVA